MINIQNDIFSEGCAHGRFQPPHNGHLEYFIAAKQRCSFLWIGITQYIISDLSSSGSIRHRERIDANPLTYYERHTLLTEMLITNGFKREQFGIVPFPIEKPENLRQFMPLNVICYTTIYDDWNREKIAILQNLGYKVEVLWERSITEKQISGLEVRKFLRSGDEAWKLLVPASIHEKIIHLDIPARNM